MTDDVAQLLLEAARQLSRYIESTKRRDIETLGRYITDSSHALPKKLMEVAVELKAQEPAAWESYGALGERYLGFSKPLDADRSLCLPLYRHLPVGAVPDAQDAFDLGFRFGRVTTSEHYEGPPLRCPDGEHYTARRKEILDKVAPRQGGGDDE